jgi:pimeloyl-ACP methyl ester carboxylesterase
MIKFTILIGAGLFFSACARENSPTSDQKINIGTHHLQIHMEGNGRPAIVIDAGIADQFDKLRVLQERLARVTRVITYNRAGYGQSEPGPLPRHCGREATELKTLLDSALVPGPYVVVGHSLGALNVQVFAARYPEKVAGIVLLDPPPLSFIRKKEYTDLITLADQMTAEWQAIADAGSESTDASERIRAEFFRMIASEHREMFGESARLVSKISSFGHTPLIVIAAGKANPAFGNIAEAYQRYWIEQSRALCQRSSNGHFIVAEESTHHIYMDVPDLVIKSIFSIIHQARGE